MMSPETRQRYKAMTNAERLRITLQMMQEAIPELLRGTPEQVDRRFELLRRRNDDRNRRILLALARAKAKEGP